jgi:hypothetical protein
VATGQTIVNRGLRLIGQLESGGTPTSDESNDALTAVNAMLDAWRNEKLMCYALQEESLTLSASDGEYTIGPSGNLNTVRPTAIEAAWILENGISYPLDPITDEEYAALPDKATASDWPDVFNYRGTVPTGTLFLYPLPNATRTLKLLTRAPLTALTLVGTVALPPGWEDALAYNLAVRIAPEYETSASPEVAAIARESKRGIKTANSKPFKSYTELPALVNRRGPGNIVSGG